MSAPRSLLTICARRSDVCSESVGGDPRRDRKLALLHEVIAAYAAEPQTRMQCVAELRVPRCSRRARGATPLNL